MTSALAPADRRLNDAYETPDPLATALVAELPIPPRSWVLEPHAGGGAFVRALRGRGHSVLAVDIDPGVSTVLDHVGDFLDYRPAEPVGWCVGNPPFRGFEEHVRHALTLAPDVAFLLRLGAMESRQRAPYWRRWPLRHVWVLAERPSFTGGGTDSAAYGFFHFRRGFEGPATITPGWSWRRG
jgi:hypothetical protein